MKRAAAAILLVGAVVAADPAGQVRPGALTAPQGASGEASQLRDPHVDLLLQLREKAAAGGQEAEVDEAVSALIGSAPPVVLGQLPYSRAGQFDAAAARLSELLERSDSPQATAARALEALARRNRRLGRLKDDTLALLRKGARRELPDMTRAGATPIVYESTAALLAAGAFDAPLIEIALGEDSPEIRRLGALALYGGAAEIDPVERTRLVRVALADRDWTVRYDALRAWIRRDTSGHGCGPIVDALADSSQHVALSAIDALADRCIDADEDEALTARLVSELRTPPNVGSWHREAHALVAAARRAPERAAIAMPAFRQHLTWQVRMYAARAAAVLDDVGTLRQLAYDSDDNVREAALLPLRRLQGADSDAAFIAALGRRDYQLVRTAALGLKGASPDKHLLAALVAALHRITAEKKETSRDIRLALIERIHEQQLAPVDLFEKLLTDFDPRIASAASAVLEARTGVKRAPSTRPPPIVPLPSARERRERLVARVELDTGRFFEIAFDRAVAPLAYARIARLVRGKYYDGLSFHRVVPNFVVQGGSPGANEYAGDGPFMRDELSATPHRRGTVGVSTRGRHTGDAQIFINLADNRALDFEYTVVGAVARPEQMAIVDTIQEGTRIVRMQMLPPTR